MRKTRRSRPGLRPARVVLAVMALIVPLLVVVGPVAAAPTSIVSNITLDGTSSPQAQGSILAHCDPCVPDILFVNADEVTAGILLELETQASWTAPAEIETTYDTDQLHQGSTVDLVNELTPGEGTISLTFLVDYTGGLFAKGDDFPDPGPLPGGWNVTGETESGSVEKTVSGACTPPLSGATTCVVSDTIGLIDLCCFLDFGLETELIVSVEFDVSADGIEAQRLVTVAVDPDEPLDFEGPSPSVVEDPFDLSCDFPQGTSINYELSDFVYEPSLTANGGVDLGLTVNIPLAPDFNTSIDLLDGVVFSNGPTMTGSPDLDLLLGTLQLDNQPPEISEIIASPSPGDEGSPIQFEAVATDNCATADELAYAWDYDDGGQSFDQTTFHTWDDDSDHTLQVEVTDPAGNSSIAQDAITINNVAPTVDAGPPQSKDWGIPVVFHANGADASAADAAGLLYTWDFDDPNDPLGAAGQDVVHVYSEPGVSTVEVEVADDDGGSSTDTVVVTITKRDTTLSYTGEVSGRITDEVHFQASLIDEWGQPVVGADVDFKVDGATKASATTDGAGTASASWVIPLGFGAGSYTLQASFAGDALYNGDDTGVGNLDVSKEKTVLTYTSSLQSKPSRAVPLSATLEDDEGNGIAGKTVVFALGSQSCMDTTNASGIASCTIDKLQQKPGQYPLTVMFDGTADPDFMSALLNLTFKIGAK